MEKNTILSKEVRGIKREQEIESVRLYEVIEQKKKVEEDMTMDEDDKRD